MKLIIITLLILIYLSRLIPNNYIGVLAYDWYLRKLGKILPKQSSSLSKIWFQLIFPFVAIFLFLIVISSIGTTNALLVLFSVNWSLLFFLSSLLICIAIISPDIATFFLKNLKDNDEPTDTSYDFNKIISGFFGPIFWFVLFGPLLAIFYFLTNQFLLKNDPDQLEINLFRYLNFPVKVVVLLSLSLVANFDKGLSLIHKNISQSEISLLDKFDPSLLEEIIYSEESTAEIQRRIRLQQVCKRGVFLWLVIISLMTLFGWTI